MASEDDMQTQLQAAIQSARYNEAVVVTVNDGSSSSTEIVLVACLDKMNGGIFWKPSKNVLSTAVTASADTTCAFRDDPGIIRHLRTKKWALPMLNDHRRNQLYDHAVRQACSEMCQRRAMEQRNNSTRDGTKIRILDIGSGTGLLAMMGAKYVDEAQQQLIAEQEHQQEVQVTSVEMASAMARLARITVEENGMSDKIKIVENHSTDSTFEMDDSRFGEGGHDSFPHSRDNEEGTTAKRIKVSDEVSRNEKADICTSELLESGLLGEGVLPSIRDAWKRHLKSDAIVLPKRARVYAVLIEGLPISATSAGNEAHQDSTFNAVTAFLGPELHAFYAASGGVWISTTSPSSSSLDSNDERVTLLGSARDGVTIPLHANAMLHKNYRDDLAHDNMAGISLGEHRGIRPLTAPVEVLDFVFSKGKNALPTPSGRYTIKDVTPTADGNCHGVLFWWELDLWDDDISTYSTNPIGSHWQDHWQQCLFVFGSSQMRKLRIGYPVKIITSHDDNSISFSISDIPTVTAPSCQDVSNIEFGHLDEINNTIHSPSNQHLSTARALQLNDTSRIRTLRAAIQYCIIAHGHDASLLDVSDMGICAMIASVLGARKVTSLESSTGALPTVAATIAQIGNGLPRPFAGFQIIQAQADHLLTNHILGGAAEIVVAEPYYEILEGWHLQEALNYFYTVRSLKKRGVVSSTALSVPAFAEVMACVVEFDEFFSAYGEVGKSNKVAGFKHSAVNYYGNHTYDVSLPLWQYRYKPLSKPFCVAKIPYEGATITIKAEESGSQFTSTGCAQAAVFWVDYHCRTTKESCEIISTATSSHRQLVRKLSKSIDVSEEDVKGGTKFYCRASFNDEKDSDGVDDYSFHFEIRPSCAQ